MTYNIDVIFSDGQRQSCKVSADTAERARFKAVNSVSSYSYKKIVGTTVLSCSGGYIYGKGEPR